ncbi:ribokinase [Serratia entomophila]|uniref:ribokinase n=1 Tax=Serratia entomophila TaxID=42906 RepID=UPI002177B6D0|nr:ribokinase [Serratia entomophila]CAI0694610.1 Ribokinase [Serratia entomophila]CAI0877560.1 Ribokinase [Serratia entomophila]CAI0880012.1 Ribokinase [Serratia entomophila]CAI1066186.1 Ribokinase [Serratia entomophila]CAI1517887.1 Ribokinase [Serratia entomophila]
MDIAVIGSNMVDLITYTDRMPNAGETLEAPEFEIGCGGKGANQAVAAAKLGASVMMVTCVGDDLFADNTLRNLQQAGVDTRYVKKVTGVSSGVAPIFVDSASQNRILIVKGANNHLLPADIERAAPALQACRLMILQLEIPLETVYAAIDFARRHRIAVILNPAPASRDLDIAYACQCDFFMPNETELEILTGMPVDSEEDILRAGRTLLAKGLRNLIITLGQRGALWMTGDRVEHVAPLQVKALDTSGAGDAFIGCFAHEYVRHGDVPQAMRQASAYAAYSVTGKGTQRSYPDASQFFDFITATRQGK